MKRKKKNTLFLHKLFIGVLLISFCLLSTLFIQQYKKYTQVEERLNSAYNSSNNRSFSLHNLLSSLNEADNLFRLYSTDFNQETYQAYKGKLLLLSNQIDSIFQLSSTTSSLMSTSTLKERENISKQYVSLKKNVNDLIEFAQDSIYSISKNEAKIPRNSRVVTIKPSVNKSIHDTTLNVRNDTIVKKRENLFKRIFNTKNDTVISQNVNKDLLHVQANILQQNVENINIATEKAYNNKLKTLQQYLLKLQSKERELINSNYRLLNNLKLGIEEIQSMEEKEIKRAQETNLTEYRESVRLLGVQLSFALVIILLTIIFILYYQSKIESYEKQLEKEQEYASKLAEEKTDILANVSHEVRAPINSVAGIIDLLRKNSDKLALNPTLIDSLSYEIEVVKSSLNDILNLSKIEAGVLELKYEDFSPVALINEIIHLHKYQATNKGLSFDYKIDVDENIQIHNSPFRIKQIISNLVGNSIKYTNAGNVSLYAYIKENKGNTFLNVTITDSGIGIAPNQLESIFRKYYVSDTKNIAGGFGLGLYISKLFAEQIGANLNVESVVNKGSTFKLSIPLKSYTIKNSNGVISLSDIPNDIKIVVIDDNLINIFHLKQFFKDFPTVKLFHIASEALQYIKGTTVDIIITDLKMPELNGWDILHQIKEDPLLNHIKVIAYTSERLILNKHSNQEMQFDGQLSKPLVEKEFSKLLLSLV